MTKIPSVRIARQFRAQCPFFLQRWHSESFSPFFLPLTSACPLTSLVFFFFFGGAGPLSFHCWPDQQPSQERPPFEDPLQQLPTCSIVRLRRTLFCSCCSS